MKNYYVYILTNKGHTVLYIGITGNLQRRTAEHQSGLIKGFSQKYRVKELIYVEMYSDVRQAIAREKQLKKWNRAKKEALIATQNPDWKDLSQEQIPETKKGETIMFNASMQRLGEERSAIRELFEYGTKRKKEIGEENVFDFSIGNPSVPAPVCVREEIKRLIDTVPPEVLHGYTSAAGAPEVRKAVSDYIQTQFHAPMSANLVYMTCGAAASLTITIHALCRGAGDEFIVPAPFFPEYRVFVEQAGGTLVAVNCDGHFHLDLSAIERAIGPNTRAIILNSPNNPTGAVYGEEELTALAALLESRGLERGEPIFLIADEPYRELTYGAEVPYPMNYYADTVICYSFSKSLSLAGERIGYIAVSPRCINAEDLFSAVCGAGRSLGFVCAPALFQRVCAASLGKCTDVGEYRQNRDLLYNALTKMGYACIPPEGAFYLFVKALEPDAVKFSERAKAHELLLVPSDSFGAEGYVRISYCVARSVIERSLPAFEALMKEYRK